MIYYSVEIKNIDFGEESETLKLWVGGTTDIYITVGDPKGSKTFRWYLSGGQETDFPESTRLLSEFLETLKREKELLDESL